MKILSAQQTHILDSATIEKQKITSLELMQRAGQKLYEEIIKIVPSITQKIIVVCATGNNGGDGLVVAQQLIVKGYDTDVYILKHSNKQSPDFANMQSNPIFNNQNLHIVDNIEKIPEIQNYNVVIDAIFGSGLNRQPEGIYAETIKRINTSNALIISIDIASGLGDGINNTTTPNVAVSPHYTLAIETPFLSQLLPQNAQYIGRIKTIKINLDKETHNSFETPYYFTEKQDVNKLIKQRSTFSHKGTFGHTLLLAGSYGKTGAAILAAKACLKSGTGLLTVHLPQKSLDIMQTAVPEAMCITGNNDYIITKNEINIEKYSAIAVGPGIGTDANTAKMLEYILLETKKYNIPIVIDADALNIIAMNPKLLEILPSKTIMTPHPGEFFRLTGSKGELSVLQKFCTKNKIVVVLKGSFTAICDTTGNIFFNSTGNPGMATAGSGDTLTGITAALLAQGLNPIDAAKLAVFTHGKAGDIAAQQFGEISTTATDIINYLPNAFDFLNQQ